MTMRTPTPELLDALRQDTEITRDADRRERQLFPAWARALLWGAAIGAVAAIIWRFSEE